MNPEERQLRHLQRLWDRRFVDRNSCSISEIIQAKHDFQQKYGWDELERVIKEVGMEVAYELQRELHQVRS